MIKSTVNVTCSSATFIDGRSHIILLKLTATSDITLHFVVIGKRIDAEVHVTMLHLIISIYSLKEADDEVQHGYVYFRIYPFSDDHKV